MGRKRTSAGWHIGRYGVCSKLNNLGIGMREREKEKGRDGGGEGGKKRSEQEKMSECLLGSL